MKNILTIAYCILVAFISSTNAQQQATLSLPPCNCSKDFAFVSNYVENHYAGFSANVTDKNRQAYDQHKAQIATEVAKEPINEIKCLGLLKNYLSFFRDAHLNVRGKSGKKIDEKSADSVAEFKKSIYFLSRERIKYDSVTIWQALDKSTDPIEGIYENDTYQIAVLANKTPERDYYAVVTKSKTPLWEEGQVKFEFKKIEKSDYEYLLFYRNHSYQIGRVTAHNPVYKLLEELKKIHPQQTASTAATPETNFDNAPNGDWFQFKALNDSTNYVHIKTFDGSLKSKFDSAYQKIAPMIEQKNNLIIDVRDNGGGSDGCWRTLSKYLYTQPFDYDKTDVFCSTGTIKRYEEFLAEVKKNKKNYGATMVIFLRKRIKAMKKAPEGTFISTIKASVPWWARPLINQKSYKQSKIYASPKKVILIYNRNSASATEGLILAAKHSKKALSFGETSQGCIAFGDVMPTNTPIGFVLDVSVQYTPNRFQYEKVGIPPQVEAQPNKDWIEQANALWHLIK